MSNKSFYSKILLFGEYSVIMQSMALSIPYPLFEGHLTFSRDKRDSRDPELVAFSNYLLKLEKDGTLPFKFDTASFHFDCSQGLIFDSTIPMGYGVGSSGALCAALYERYGTKKEDNLFSIEQLKHYFSIMEGHFHGSSSGIDPLISYLNQSILLDENKNLGQVSIPKYENGNGAVFLLNTGRSRKTEPLVNLFLEKRKNKDFESLCIDSLIPTTNNCIRYFLEGQINSLLESYRKLSLFQYEHFSPMIPKLYVDLWKSGLESSDYFLKLCGAGGGGFILGITENFKKVSNSLSGHEVRALYRF